MLLNIKSSEKWMNLEFILPLIVLLHPAQMAQKPYTAINLEAELQAATKAFLCDPEKNILTAEKVQLSKIFLWFAEDFGSKKNG